MTPERHRRVREVFLGACELGPDERAGYLDRACGGDEELRALVDALLARDRAPGGVAGEGATARGSVAEPAARLALGQVVDGKYVIEARLGAGGMGEVYRARQLALDRAVAIKVLPPDPHPGSGKRFEREARSIARLRHPNVVAVYDLGLAPGVGAYLVMEYVEGRTLGDELRRHTVLPVADAVALIGQVCVGVAAAHAAGVVHRDLKPANVLVEGEGERAQAKVADFGIARFSEPAVDGAEPLTGTGAVIGTPHYMSPEQCRGEAADARSDVYAIGSVLYELLSGRPPFVAESVFGLLEKHRTETPVALRELRPEVGAELERVVARALEKGREQRWQSAAALGDALAGVARGDAIGRGETALPDTEVLRPVVASEPAGTSERASEPAAPNNLRRPLTRCIGRERELAELAALLGDDGVRLVTITGAGGIGKTRLAVEVGHALAPKFADGVFEVDLAALSDPALVAQHIAHVFGVTESAASPVAESLARFLGGKRMLLVLDNFEHLVAGAPQVTRLLEAATGVKALVTSQALLHLRGEHEYPLDALDVPALNAHGLAEDLERSPAVALFLERAREAKRGFALTGESGRAVAEVCRRLDGLPLAIELAAARVKLLAPQAMLARLTPPLALLVGGARDLPERQRTMRGTVAWSYELLGEEERALLRRLSVFSGGCTLEAAEAVCGFGGVDVLEALASLVDKSLLRQREQVDGAARFGMLEVVREFALERLEAEGEADEARLDHARYFLELAIEAGMRSGGDDASLVASLAREHENLSSALGVLLEREPRDGARMAVALRRYWVFRNLFSEGLGWAKRALASGGAGPAERALLLGLMGGSEGLLGDHEAAGEHLGEAVEASRALDDKSVLYAALHWQAINSLKQPAKVAEARPYLEEALEIAREIGDVERVAFVLHNLAVQAKLEGDQERARAITEEALDICPITTHRATCLLNLGDLLLEDVDLARASERLNEALVLVAGFGDWARAAYALESLTEIAFRQGAPEKAARLAGAVDALDESTGGARFSMTEEHWERSHAKLREALEPAAFEREWARGRAMGLDDAIAEALRDD